MRKRYAAGFVIVGVLVLAGEAGANGWIITSVHQIKPGVLKKIQPRLQQAEVLDSVVQTMGPSGSGAEVASSDARCPSGTAIAGGWDGGNSPSPDQSIGYDERDADGGGWHVIAVNNSSLTTTIQAQAICLAQASFGARDTSVPAAVQAQIHRELLAVQAHLK